MKTAKTFRLSEQAIKQLETLHQKTGANETAIIEIALALFEQAIIDRTFGEVSKKGGFPDKGGPFGSPKVQDPNVLLEQVEQEATEDVFIVPRKKKRKRKH